MVIRNGEICECNRCGHKWLPRDKNADGTFVLPKCCAAKRCKSPLWNRPIIELRERTANIGNPQAGQQEVKIAREKSPFAKIVGVAASETKINNTTKINAASKKFSKFFAKGSSKHLATILSSMRSASEEITLYASQAELSFANCNPTMSVMCITKAPASSFKQFTFLPSPFAVENPEGATLEFAVDADKLLKAMNWRGNCQDVSLSSIGDGYLHIDHDGTKYSLQQLKSNHMPPTASEFAYVAKLIAPTDFVQGFLGDMDVVADQINIAINNSSEILFTGVGDGRSGMVVKRIVPIDVKRNGIDVTFSASRRVQSTFDLSMLRRVVDSVRTPMITLEVAVDGPMKISTELDGATSCIHLAHKIVAEVEAK